MAKIVLCTGGFDPLHSGHIDFFAAARQLGDILIVGINSDEWLTRKKGRPFLLWHERAAVIEHLRMVDAVLDFDDSDDTSCDAIQRLLEMYPDDTVIFANGGDRKKGNTPEQQLQHAQVKLKFGVGGSIKRNSSSEILAEWRAARTQRPWGYYRVLYQINSHTKVKELTVDAGCSLSMQRHSKRSEHWVVAEGACIIKSRTDGGYELPPRTLTQHQYAHIPVGEWHQLTNPFDQPCKIVEIQYGESCIEEDIERQ